MRTLLITGGCGFLGSNLAHEALLRGWNLIVFDNLSRQGSKQNLRWLQSLGTFTFIEGDIRKQDDVQKTLQQHQPDAVFHLAGQVAMTTSLENPKLDFEVNALGTLNLLEAVRKYSSHTAILYSSTNKVYGDFTQMPFVEESSRYRCSDWPNGFDETLPLDFHSPYGCSKGCADQYLLDYARLYNLKTVVFRHSSMYGARQFATKDQGWVGWFVQQALETVQQPHREPFTICGNGKQVRDLLHADDVIHLYFAAVHTIDTIQGEVFNIGGGIHNSLSLLELFTFLNDQLAIQMHFQETAWRASDQKVFIADISKARTKLQWQPAVNYQTGINNMITWLQKEQCLVR